MYLGELMKAALAHIRRITTLLPSLLLLALNAPSFAQSSAQSPTLKVPPIIEVQSGIETQLPIEVMPENTQASQAMLLVKGIPSSVSLTDGRLFPSGVWAIKISTAPAIRILTASDAKEDRPITIALMSLSGKTLDEVSSRLIIAPHNGFSDQLANAVPVNAISTRDIAPQEKEKIFTLMQRGDAKFREGKAYAARVFYEKAAEMGWPAGAFALAKTYDAAQLQGRTFGIGIEPDAVLARQWYEKARDLGSPRADARLKEIGLP